MHIVSLEYTVLYYTCSEFTLAIGWCISMCLPLPLRTTAGSRRYTARHIPLRPNGDLSNLSDLRLGDSERREPLQADAPDLRETRQYSWLPAFTRSFPSQRVVHNPVLYVVRFEG